MSRAFLLFPRLLRLLAAPIPMKSERDALQGEARARCLLVFLPSVADRAQTFRDQGFVDALRERNLSVDVISAGSTIGYYLRGVDARRLEQDVVWPARTRGYAHLSPDVKRGAVEPLDAALGAPHLAAVARVGDSVVIGS